MAQMNISVPDVLKDWVETQVAEGSYLSTSDYVRDLVRRDRDYRLGVSRDEAEWLRAEIEQGLASGVSPRSLNQIHAANRARRAAA